jgi:hypothetical protein
MTYSRKDYQEMMQARAAHIRENLANERARIKHTQSVKYAEQVKIVEAAGMSVSDDGVAFTVCGGQLVNGQEAPQKIKDMNGWGVEDVAKELCKAG